jgi:uncharacterized protein (TIGR03083 family)
MATTTTSTAGRLLRTEAAALLPILRSTPDPDFDRPTLLPGWSVRDVLAHCSAALGMAVTGRFHGFSPEENQQDVDARADWPVDRLLAELEASYEGAAAAMDAAGGRLDGLALGEWVHGGDVRQALGRAAAWRSDGLTDALTLLVAASVRAQLPPTRVTLTGPGPEREFGFGDPAVEPRARLRTDAASLIRLCAGRSPDPAAIDLTGAGPEEYRIFA